MHNNNHFFTNTDNLNITDYLIECLHKCPFPPNLIALADDDFSALIAEQSSKITKRNITSLYPQSLILIPGVEIIFRKNSVNVFSRDDLTPSGVARFEFDQNHSVWACLGEK